MVDIDLSTLQLSIYEIVIRFFCAMMIGAVIGMEREFTHRPAGLRTHMLVALGSCAVMITSQMLFCQYRPYGSTADPARLSAQVITGVGFLGAGTILREGATVKGLTTAASIWAVACLGIAIGAGYYVVAMVGFGCILVTLTVFEWLQHKLLKKESKYFRFTITSANAVSAIKKITAVVNEANVRISNIQLEEESEETCRITFCVNFTGGHAQENVQSFVRMMKDKDSIVSIETEQVR